MASVINTNISSLNTQRNLAASQSSLNTSLQRLSSGLRINSSKDDAAGLAIATKMDSQIRGQQVAIRNSNDAISFAQTAEGGLAKQTDAIQRMRELAVQSANATNSSSDRVNLDAEYTELKAEVTRLTARKDIEEKRKAFRLKEETDRRAEFDGVTLVDLDKKVKEVDDKLTTATADVATLTASVDSLSKK